MLVSCARLTRASALKEWHRGWPRHREERVSPWARAWGTGKSPQSEVRSRGCRTSPPPPTSPPEPLLSRQVQRTESFLGVSGFQLGSGGANLPPLSLASHRKEFHANHHCIHQPHPSGHLPQSHQGHRGWTPGAKT